MTGIFIALISGALMSLQGVFNTEVTKQSSIWVSASWVQFSVYHLYGDSKHVFSWPGQSDDADCHRPAYGIMAGGAYGNVRTGQGDIFLEEAYGAFGGSGRRCDI